MFFCSSSLLTQLTLDDEWGEKEKSSNLFYFLIFQTFSMMIQQQKLAQTVNRKVFQESSSHLSISSFAWEKFTKHERRRYEKNIWNREQSREREVWEKYKNYLKRNKSNFNDESLTLHPFQFVHFMFAAALCHAIRLRGNWMRAEPKKRRPKKNRRVEKGSKKKDEKCFNY